MLNFFPGPDHLRCALIGQKFGIANQNENFFTELAPGPKLNFGSVIISHNERLVTVKFRLKGVTLAIIFVIASFAPFNFKAF